MTDGPVMHDRLGRVVDDLRVSVTDLCNLRCQYCMPAEGVAWLPREEILSFEEITRLVGVFVHLGVDSVRLTGGEPLVRRGFPNLARSIGGVPGIEDLSVTTNGLLLERDAEGLADAGIHRFNVSLDAIDPERYEQVTRRRGVDRVLAGLRLLLGLPGVRRVKVNAVSIRGITDHEVPALVALAQEFDIEVRFIEQMPLGAGAVWARDRMLSGTEVREMVEAVHPLTPRGREPHATATVFDLTSAPGRIAFINPVSQPFCEDCNRIRLTADGHLRTCLFGHRETDLRGPMRAGASDAEIGAIIRDAVWDKERGHLMDSAAFRSPERTMSQIGG